MKGHTRRRGRGWEYRFDLPPDPLTGRRREVCKMGFATKKEAEAALRKAIDKSEQGRHVAPSRRTLAEFLDEWLASIQGRIRPSTWSNYRDYRDAYVLPTLGETHLQDLSTRRLNLFYTHLLNNGRIRKAEGLPRGLAPKTVRNVHVMLHRALRDACRWGYISHNPAEDAEPPLARRKKPKVWTPDQLRTFVEHVRGDRFYALWLLIATTGLRRGELAGLRIQDVDLKARRITPEVPRVVVDGYAQTSEPKTDSGYRRIALDPITVEALAEHIRCVRREHREFGITNGLLFCWPDGSPVHPQTITDRFFKLSRQAKLPVIRLHDVRHSYATAALRAGVHPKVVSERLGHASVAFTLQTYSHVIEGMDDEAAATIANHILGTKEAGDSSPLRRVDDDCRENPEGS